MSLKSSLLISGLLHGLGLGAVVYLDFSPLEPPALSGGSGAGGLEVVLRPAPPAGAERGQERGPEEPISPGAPEAREPGADPRPPPAPGDARRGFGAAELLASLAALAPVDLPSPAGSEPCAAEAAPELPPLTELPPLPAPAPLPEAAPPPPAAANAPPASLPAPPPASPMSPDGGGALAGGAKGPGVEAPGLDDPNALRPVYPLECRRLNHQGAVLLRVSIGTDGKALAVDVARSAGCPDLDRAAVDAMRRARFQPARRWGRPMACTIEQEVRFELHG